MMDRHRCQTGSSRCPAPSADEPPTLNDHQLYWFRLDVEGAQWLTLAKASSLPFRPLPHSSDGAEGPGIAQISACHPAQNGLERCNQVPRWSRVFWQPTVFVSTEPHEQPDVLG